MQRTQCIRIVYWNPASAPMHTCRDGLSVRWQATGLRLLREHPQVRLLIHWRSAVPVATHSDRWTEWGGRVTAAETSWGLVTPICQFVPSSSPVRPLDHVGGAASAALLHCWRWASGCAERPRIRSTNQRVSSLASDQMDCRRSLRRKWTVAQLLDVLTSYGLQGHQRTAWRIHKAVPSVTSAFIKLRIMRAGPIDGRRVIQDFRYHMRAYSQQRNG